MDELEKTAQETAAEEQTGDTTAPDAGEDFETLIRGRYKGEFDARVRKILDGRLRGLRQENERLRQEAVRTELLRQRDSGGGRTDRRDSGEVAGQREATRQEVRPR